MQLHLLTGVASVLVLQVMKYADNILKGFATGISTLLSTLCSVVLFVRPRPRPYPLPPVLPAAPVLSAGLACPALSPCSSQHDGIAQSAPLRCPP